MITGAVSVQIRTPANPIHTSEATEERGERMTRRTFRLLAGRPAGREISRAAPAASVSAGKGDRPAGDDGGEANSTLSLLGRKLIRPHSRAHPPRRPFFSGPSLRQSGPRVRSRARRRRPVCLLRFHSWAFSASYRPHSGDVFRKINRPANFQITKGHLNDVIYFFTSSLLPLLPDY
jgi:hypothetical protein